MYGIIRQTKNKRKYEMRSSAINRMPSLIEEMTLFCRLYKDPKNLEFSLNPANMLLVDACFNKKDLLAMKRALKEGADAKLRNTKGTLLQFLLLSDKYEDVSKETKLEIIKLFVDYGYPINTGEFNDLINIEFYLVASELHTGKKSSLIIFDYLVEKGGNVHYTDKTGYNFIALTCLCYPHYKMVEYLLEKGVNPLQKTLNGETAEQLAALNKEKLTFQKWFKQKITAYQHHMKVYDLPKKIFSINHF